MHSNPFRLAAIVGGLVSSVAMAGTVSLLDSPITGPSSADFAAWKVSGANLTLDNATPLSTILQGGPVAVPGDTNPQGNVELFASSETGAFASTLSGGAFATHASVSISGSLQSVPISLRSLNGNDWFTTPSSTYDTSYAGPSNNDTLARKWFNDFVATHNIETALLGVGLTQTVVDAERAVIYNALLATGGFQRISDPNISYVIQDDLTDAVSVGLAGTQEFLKNQILAYVDNSSVLNDITRPQVKALVLATTIDASELVMINYNGVESPYYSFAAQSVGLTTDDVTESYNQNFNITFTGIPEPASLSVLAMGALGLMRRRRV